MNSLKLMIEMIKRYGLHILTVILLFPFFCFAKILQFAGFKKYGIILERFIKEI